MPTRARTALSRANLRLFQDVLLAGGTGADLAAIGKAIEAACELPQLSFEVRFGELSDEALAALERGGTLDPAAAAKQGSIELPSLLGQPFGVAFVSEGKGRAPRGLELEGLALARADGDVTLVASPAAGSEVARKPCHSIVRRPGARVMRPLVTISWSRAWSGSAGRLALARKRAAEPSHTAGSATSPESRHSHAPKDGVMPTRARTASSAALAVVH